MGGEAPSCRVMHEAVFESGWDAAAFIQHHRAEVAHAYQGRGRPVISLDWTLSHHERGPKIYAVTKSYDYVERRTTLFQTVVTAVVSNREWIDGLEVVVQDPKDLKAEAASAKRRPKRAMNRWRRHGSAWWKCCYSRIHQLQYRKGRRSRWRSYASWKPKASSRRPIMLLIMGCFGFLDAFD